MHVSGNHFSQINKRVIACKFIKTLPDYIRAINCELSVRNKRVIKMANINGCE